MVENAINPLLMNPEPTIADFPPLREEFTTKKAKNRDYSPPKDDGSESDGGDEGDGSLGIFV